MKPDKNRMFGSGESKSTDKELLIIPTLLFAGIALGTLSGKTFTTARACVRTRFMAGVAAEIQQKNPGKGFSAFMKAPNFFRYGEHALELFPGEKPLVEEVQKKFDRMRAFKKKSEREFTIESLYQENPWITTSFGAVDQAVKQEILLPIVPLREADVNAMNSYMNDQNVAGAMFENPPYISPTNLWFIRNAEGIPYQYYMYLADMTATTITHESAHFLLDSKLTKDELDNFAKMMIKNVHDDLANLYQKQGDEEFNDNKMVLIDTLQLMYYSLPTEVDRAHEYFAHIVEFSHSFGMGLENIQKLLPKTAEFMTRFYKEHLELPQHLKREVRIEVVEDVSSDTSKVKKR